MSHVELLVAIGEPEGYEVNLAEDRRSDAVKRLQPPIDQTDWTESFYRVTEQHLQLLRDTQRELLQAPTPSRDMENTEGIKITEFDEFEEDEEKDHETQPDGADYGSRDDVSDGKCGPTLWNN